MNYAVWLTVTWGKLYKIVIGKLCKKQKIPGLDILGRMKHIIEG